MAQGVQIDEYEAEAGFNSLANRLKKWIKYIAFIVASTFTFLQLSTAPLDEITKTVTNTALLKVGLFIYFFGWYFGATHDTEIQQIGYQIDPDRGRLGMEEIGGIAVFLLVFVAMYYTHSMPIVFQIVLLAFICTNLYTWRIIFDRTIPMIDATKKKLSSKEHFNMFSLARLNVVVNYMNGRWQKARFFTLIALCIVQLCVAFVIENGWVIGFGQGILFGGVELSNLIQYIPGLLFIVYVLIAEVWMKMYRIRAFADLRNLTFFEQYFTMKPRDPSKLPPIDTTGVFGKMIYSHPNYKYDGPLDWIVDPQ